jgi:signal recognition particle GTPase
MLDLDDFRQQLTNALKIMSRRARIAAGSGVKPSEVFGLLTQFHALAALLRRKGSSSSRD